MLFQTLVLIVIFSYIDKLITHIYLTFDLNRLKKLSCINKMWWEKDMEEAVDFDFQEIHPLSDKDFWVGKSAYIPSTNEQGEEDIEKCIVHVKTNLLISYDGVLLGRYKDDEMIPVEELPVEITEWYKKCLTA